MTPDDKKRLDDLLDAHHWEDIEVRAACELLEKLRDENAKLIAVARAVKEWSKIRFRKATDDDNLYKAIAALDGTETR